MAGSHSSWRSEDLLDLERCGLAAELASTNLGSSESGEGGSGNGWGQSGSNQLNSEVDFTYDMSELENLLLDQLLPSPSSNPTLTTPSRPPPQAELSSAGEQVEVFLKAPTAYGIKTDQPKVTYLNRGYSYEIQLQHSAPSPMLFNGTLSLGFCDIHRRNGERQYFEEWSKDHPCDRLLEIDSNGSVGVSGACNDESALNTVRFSWGQSHRAVLAIKINCLSTEFAAKKHGGEKGVPLKLGLEVWPGEESQGSQGVWQRGCVIKVFKDKGGDRKQRQDLSKLEKLPPEEQVKFHPSDNTTRFEACDLDSSSISNTSLSNLSFTPKIESDHVTSSQAAGASPLLVAPPLCSMNACPGPSHLELAACGTVDETRQWLVLNRFGQYCSLFANFTGRDLLQLARRDLLDLCGHADGIRLYNSLHSHTLKTLYVRLHGDKVYEAICLEELTMRRLLEKLLDKLVRLDVQQVSSFVRLTRGGVCVRMDDTVVLSMQDEASFLLQTVKEEDGRCQLVLQDHVPSEHELPLSLAGSISRH